MKKIYFAGSIRGGRDDAALYREIIAHIQKTDIVLTEHIGSVKLEELPIEQAGDEAIYRQDVAWLQLCDMVIAECSTPSLGVGYELGFAEAHGIPCHVFWRKEEHLSAMIGGDGYFQLHPYATKEELMKEIDRAIGNE